MERAIRRARLYVEHGSFKVAAQVEGVSPPRMTTAVEHVFDKVSHTLKGNEELPDGLRWETSEWRGSYVSQPRQYTVDMVRWALAVLDGKRVCPSCGRPLDKPDAPSLP